MTGWDNSIDGVIPISFLGYAVPLEFMQGFNVPNDTSNGVIHHYSTTNYKANPSTYGTRLLLIILIVAVIAIIIAVVYKYVTYKKEKADYVIDQIMTISEQNEALLGEHRSYATTMV